MTSIQKINTHLWESPSLIPVLLMVVKENLTQWETQRYAQSEKTLSPRAQQINQYLTLCQRWEQTALNDRQRQWLREIECYLQNYLP